MYSKENIGANIKDLRVKRHLTQMELAEKINPVGAEGRRSRIAKWESGSAVPDVASLIDLCNALDCDIDYLLGAIQAPKRATHDVMEQTGLSAQAVDFLRPHSNDWQTDVLSLLIEEYADINGGPDFLQVLAEIYNYYEVYASAENNKKAFVRESYRVRAEEKGTDINDWENMLKIEATRSITNSTLERDAQLVKAQRLSVYESFIAVVDKIVKKQYEKNSKKV